MHVTGKLILANGTAYHFVGSLADLVRTGELIGARRIVGKRMGRGSRRQNPTPSPFRIVREIPHDEPPRAA